MDGHCGNFNGNIADDDRLQVRSVLGQLVWNRVRCFYSMRRRRSPKETAQISTTVHRQLWKRPKQIVKQSMVASSPPCTVCWTIVLQGKRWPCKADQLHVF